MSFNNFYRRSLVPPKGDKPAVKILQDMSDSPTVLDSVGFIPASPGDEKRNAYRVRTQHPWSHEALMTIGYYMRGVEYYFKKDVEELASNSGAEIVEEHHVSSYSEGNDIALTCYPTGFPTDSATYINLPEIKTRYAPGKIAPQDQHVRYIEYANLSTNANYRCAMYLKAFFADRMRRIESHTTTRIGLTPRTPHYVTVEDVYAVLVKEYQHHWQQHAVWLVAAVVNGDKTKYAQLFAFPYQRHFIGLNGNLKQI